MHEHYSLGLDPSSAHQSPSLQLRQPPYPPSSMMCLIRTYTFFRNTVAHHSEGGWLLRIGLQGYLAYEPPLPPQGHHGALGKVLL